MLGADILFFKEHTLSYYGIPSILEVPRPNHNSENHKNMFQDIFLNIHILFYHITRTRSGLSSHVGLVMIFYENRLFYIWHSNHLYHITVYVRKIKCL